MADAFLGEIRIFAGTYAPKDWAFCNGQLLAVSQYSALFSLFGTVYGGDGRSSFGLPDMRGRIAMGQGQGAGLSYRHLGQRFGEEEVVLDISQIPSHNHPLQASTVNATSTTAINTVIAKAEDDPSFPQFGLYSDQAVNTQLASDAVETTGADQSHDNMMPYLVTNYIVALKGNYPSRN
ncbi:phage tail protein [Marinomonas mediterranea]|uniref:phage tail protein n=1 Tax=Marinomonas mediterranea TaxID=119864 RepID=UPI002349D550|nr:tail fiber protein [Marinomonas mediterranea]WCN08584.1 phage tail protein [Marinomonas mediterranea]WCN12638.1 phage tail protein [Marinomonas mediterranea]